MQDPEIQNILSDPIMRQVFVFILFSRSYNILCIDTNYSSCYMSLLVRTWCVAGFCAGTGRLPGEP